MTWFWVVLGVAFVAYVTFCVLQRDRIAAVVDKWEAVHVARAQERDHSADVLAQWDAWKAGEDAKRG